MKVHLVRIRVRMRVRVRVSGRVTVRVRVRVSSSPSHSSRVGEGEQPVDLAQQDDDARVGGVRGAEGAVADAALAVDVDVEHGGVEAHLGRA